MKYVNFIATTLVSCALVAGCSGTGGGTKKVASKTKAEITLSSTSEFIPVPKVDSAGVAIPYVPTENPYTLQKGKVKKESIAKYIDATRAFKQKQYEQAEKLSQELTTEDKSLSGPWILIGDIATEQKNYDKAIASYEKAIVQNSKNINAYLRLAKTRRLKGQFLEAQNTYAKSLALWRDCPEAHLNLAILYDIYLNHPLRAQKHMEAYQYLTGGEDKTVEKWLVEIQKRTGVPASLIIDKKKAESKPLS
jgi:lipopolysaccharide biosynthesis regulator YciM